MSARFAELAWRATPLGEVSLRRRRDPTLDVDVYEVKLDDDFLMSSLFTVAEIEVARLALAELAGGGPDMVAGGGPDAVVGGGLDVVVGGLGLGYTALTVLESPRVRSMLVVEALDAVVQWHEEGLIPAGATLTADPRCRFAVADFFALAAAPEGLDPQAPGRRFHAVIVDIDHSPRHLLNPANASFYLPAGLRRLAGQLHPGGVFSLWSNDPPDEEFIAALAGVFATARAVVVTFPNPLQDRPATNTVYLATTAAH